MSVSCIVPQGSRFAVSRSGIFASLVCYEFVTEIHAIFFVCVCVFTFILL